VKLTLPWPPKELMPNAARRRHWSVNGRAAKIYRQACWALAKEARVSVTAGDVPILLSLTFHPPDKRNRDDDGIISAFKSGRDGLADAMGVDDKQFRPTYIIAEPVKGGSVEVEIL